MPVDQAVNGPAVTLVRAPRGWQRVRATMSRVGAFAIVELQKLRHDRTELVTRMVQPALWLLIFGTTFSQLHVIHTGSVSYLAFLAPGIIAQSALFISIFYGIQIIWDRDAGVLAKLMVTPAPASALITGKAFAAGVRSVAQVVGVMALAYMMRVGLTDQPAADPGGDGRRHARRRVLRLPVDDAGRTRPQPRSPDGYRPSHHHAVVLRIQRAVPGRRDAAWLHVLSKVNPLSYEVDALRALLIGTPFNPLDIVVLVVAAVIGIATASTLLRRLVCLTKRDKSVT